MHPDHFGNGSHHLQDRAPFRRPEHHPLQHHGTPAGRDVQVHVPQPVVGLQGLLDSQGQGAVPDLLAGGFVGLELRAVRQPLHEFTTALDADPLRVDHESYRSLSSHSTSKNCRMRARTPWS